MRKIYLAGVLSAYLFASCAGHSEHAHDDAHEHEHAQELHERHEEHEGHDEHEHEGHEHEEAGHDHAKAGEVVFHDERAKAIGLLVQKIEPGTFTEVIKTGGQILAAQGDESVVVATIPGVVTLGGLPFVDGTAVKKGEMILSIASKSLSQGDVAARTKAAYETAKREYERMAQLVDDKIVSLKDFEQARLNYENARAAYEALADKRTEKGVAVVAPIGGYLKSLLVKEGDYVTVGQPLATISRAGRLMMRADVPARYYRSLPDIRTANFKMPYDTTVYRLEDLKGRLLSYGRASGGAGFYVPVTFELDNRGGLIPGSFVEIYLLTRPLENVLSVPTSALIEEQGIYSVYVRVHEEHYRKQEVTLGASDGANVQILSGLNAGDEVVTRGAYQIKLSSASNAIPAHTHNH